MFYKTFHVSAWNWTGSKHSGVPLITILPLGGMVSTHRHRPQGGLPRLMWPSSLNSLEVNLLFKVDQLMSCSRKLEISIKSYRDQRFWDVSCCNNSTQEHSQVRCVKLLGLPLVLVPSGFIAQLLLGFCTLPHTLPINSPLGPTLACLHFYHLE
jgi:hypothetical protein